MPQYQSDAAEAGKGDSAAGPSQLFARLPIAFLQWDQGNSIRYCNDAALRLFGYAVDQVIGQSLKVLFEDRAIPAILSRPDAGPDSTTLHTCRSARGEILFLHWRLITLDPEAQSTGENLRQALLEDVTETIHLSRELDVATQAYKELSEHLNDFIYVHDLEGNFLRINENGARVFGYEVEEFLKLNVRDIVMPDHLQKAQNSISNKLQGDKKSSPPYEILVKKKNGETFWLEVSNRLMEADGKPVGVQGIARDVTERKIYEEQLSRSEQKFRSIFETIDDIYVHINKEGIVDIVSPSVSIHLGYEPEEIIGKPAEVFYANQSERNLLLQKLHQYGNIQDYEVTFRHKNDTVIPFSVNARLQRDDNGNIVGIEGLARNIVQRKQHERAVLANEQRFRRIFESIQDVYFRVEGGLIKFVSPSCKAMFGYAPEEMIGQPTEIFYRDADARKDMLDEFTQKGYLNDYEIEYVHKSGRYITCSLNLRALRNEHNEIIAMEGTLRDITARKESEEALRQSEQRFRRIFESLQDVYYEADKTGLVTILSPSVFMQYGYHPEELVGKPATTVYADPNQRDELLQALSKKGFVNDFELSLVNKNGEIKPTSCSTKFIIDNTGTPIGVQGVLRDISERKKADEALRDSESRFRSIFNSIPDLFLEINSLDSIVNASPSISQFGFTPKEVIGRNISNLFSTPKAWTELHKQLERDKEIKDYEMVLLTRQSHPVPVSVTAYQISKSGMHAARNICIIRDISQHKRDAQELELARDQALEASRAKSSFLANISHELRTPLNAIIGYSEMLTEDAVDAGLEEFVEDLGKINNAGQHLLSLINGVLDLSKIEAGKMELVIEDVTLPPILDEIMLTITPLARKNNNSLEHEYPSDLCPIRADKIKLKQALYNLLSNACKFTRNGKVRLEVEMENAGKGTWVLFRIIDNGIGITPDQMHKLFSEFTQADSSTTREYGGTGLGLVISQRFCQLMGGDIEANSRHGQGSIFTIRLPANCPAAKG